MTVNDIKLGWHGHRVTIRHAHGTIHGRILEMESKTGNVVHDGQGHILSIRLWLDTGDLRPREVLCHGDEPIIIRP